MQWRLQTMKMQRTLASLRSSIDRAVMRRVLSPVLVILGALLLGYVGAQYAHMYLEQRHLAQEWQKQQQVLRGDPAAEIRVRPTENGLTRLSVPKIDLDSVVVEGTSHKSLLLGPGHMTETPEPGALGNSVITGHRDTFFRHIHELERGDSLLVQREGKTFKYEVVGKKVVEPDDLSVLGPASDSRLTLITCYPTYYIGPAPKRLVVFSKLVDESSDARAASSGAAASSGLR